MPLLLGGGKVQSHGKTYDSYSDYNDAKASNDSSSASKSSSSTGDVKDLKTTSSADSAELDALLNDSNLTDAEQQAIRSVYDAVAAGDTQRAQEMIARLELAGQYADPILKRQISLISDELTRTVEGIGEDLEYSETSLQNRLNDLKSDLEYNSNYYSLQEQAELKKLETYFGEKLIETRDTMAARGMTASRKRERSEEMLAEQKGDMVEGTQREFAAKQRELAVTGDRSERDTALELERLQQLSDRDKTTVLRSGEEALGSQRIEDLGVLGDTSALGNIEGQVDLDYRDQLADFAF